MSRKDIVVTFRTITPLWTGDAWQDNCKIRPSSLMGSLRFWFEVICYFSGICKIEKESDKVVNFKEGRFEKEVDREKLEKCLLEKGNYFQAKIECLNEQKIPLPSIIFGTTNWKSLIEIESIKYLKNYCFGNYFNLPYAIAFSKRNKSDKPKEFNTKEELNTFIDMRYKNRSREENYKKFREEYSVFYLSTPYFYGDFTVIFNVEEEIIEPIFFPLLTFMEKYGFWGGKWNIGYGRLKVESVKIDNTIENNWKRDKFDLSIFKKNKNIRLDDLIQEVNTFNDLIGNQTLIKIRFLKYLTGKTTFKEGIEELLKEKSIKRGEFRDSNEKRHKIFGKTGNPRQMSYVPQGSKILPYIFEENGQFSGGFLSIVGLLNLD